MDIITSGNTELINLISKVLDNCDCEFKISKFISIFDYKKKNCIVLFNSFTRKIIALTKDEYKTLEVSINEQKNSGIIEILRRELMIINDSIDENQLYDDVRKAFLIENHQEFKGNEIFVIFTTTVCNARCFYCFEKNTKYITMNDQTAKQVAEYIIKTRNPDKPVCLHWFGGEPLCNISAIETICTYLKKNGIIFTSRFTSNASMFNAEISEKSVRDWNTDRVQITLDGTEKEHNKRKNYINSKVYNFTTTINNIEILAKLNVQVTIRINCDVGNIEDADKLVDFLGKRFSEYNNIFLDPHPIFNCDNNEQIPETNYDFYNKLVILENKTSAYNLSNNAEVKKNSKRAFEKFRLGSCQSVSMRIAPDGKLYPCQHIDQVKSYGNIYDGITDEQMYLRWKSEKHSIQCINCSYRPLCACLEFCNANRERCQEYANLKYQKWVFELCDSYFELSTYVKLSKSFHIHKILDTIIAIEVSDNSEVNLKTVIKMNETSYYMWKYIEIGITKKELIDKILEKYDIDFHMAEKSVCCFISYLNSKGLIEL